MRQRWGATCTCTALLLRAESGVRSGSVRRRVLLLLLLLLGGRLMSGWSILLWLRLRLRLRWLPILLLLLLHLRRRVLMRLLPLGG